MGGKIKTTFRDSYTNLKFHHVLHFGGFTVADAGMEETGGHADAQGFAGHAGRCFFAIWGDHPKSAEQKHQQSLRINGQRRYYPTPNKKKTKINLTFDS